MQIAGNKLQHLLNYYKTELSGVYTIGEIEAQFAEGVRYHLGFSRKELQNKLQHNLNQSDVLKIYDLAKSLKTRKPLQYLLGESYFYGLTFYVNASVLIPRPETEELVDVILKGHTQLGSVLDIGTGSGCIPISIKKNQAQAKVYACDISLEALQTAKKNAQLNNTDIIFFETDILKNYNCDVYSGTFDLIVSNPPYILSTEKKQMEQHVLEYEPHLALFVEGQDSVVFYKKIIDLCATKLNPGAFLYFELNPLTASQVLNYAEDSKLFSTMETIKDMSGHQRFFKAQKKHT